MTRRHLSLTALAVVLVALGIALLPFGWRDPYRAGVSCSPAAWSVWQTQKMHSWATPNGPSFVNPFTTPLVAVPTACALHARGRLQTAGTLLGLTVLGVVVGRKVLPKAPPLIPQP